MTEDVSMKNTKKELLDIIEKMQCKMNKKEVKTPCFDLSTDV